MSDSSVNQKQDPLVPEELSQRPKAPSGLANRATAWPSIVLALALSGFVLWFFPPPFDQLPYLTFCILFVLVVVGAVGVAVRTEVRLRAVADEPSSAAENSLVAELWGLYWATMRQTRSGDWKTSATADGYFNPDSILAVCSWKGFPILGILKSVSGTFTGLGILGTFVGFAVGLQSFDATSAEAIQKSVQQLIKGITIGFNFSIIGITMSIVFNLILFQPFLRRMESLADQICDGLDRLHHESESEELADEFAVINEVGRLRVGEALRNLLELNHKQARSMERFSSEIADRLGDIVVQSMQPVFDRLSTALERIENQQQAVSGDVGKSIVAELQEMMSTLSDKIIGENMNQVHALIERLQTIGETLGDVPGTIKVVQEGVVQATNTATRSLEAVPASMEAMTGQLAQALEAFRHAQELSVSKVGETVREVDQGFQLMRRSIEATGTALGTFQPTIDKLHQIAGRLDSISDHLAESQSGHLQAMEVLEASIGTQLESLQSGSAGIIEVRTSLEAERSLLQASTGAFEGLDRQIAATIGQVTGQVQNYHDMVDRGLSSLLTQFGQKASDFGQGLSAAIKELRSVVEDLAEIAEKVGKDE